MTEPDPRVCPLCSKPLRGDGCCLLCPTLRYGKRVYHVDSPAACPSCRLLLAKAPEEIASAYALLPELVVPGAHGGDGRSKNPEAPLPFTVDPMDLTAPWQLPQGPLRLGRLGANAGDQIGHLPVVASLGTWVRDWIAIRDLGESGPESTVPAMAAWLAVRTEWAVENHGAVDEYADEMVQLRGLLWALTGRPTVDERPKPLPVPCPRCRHMSLTRRADDYVQCEWPDCQRVFRPEEWLDVSRATAKWAGKAYKRQSDGSYVPRESEEDAPA